ncbi:hypothetical protein Ae406Ps2_6402 [Pseudonocardia sp. Ae406_Ps2]|nr:hypothetical protein Ae406Ps2_6402 [Pseudonocardia sp. Ae406_Ps2]
MDVEMCPSSVTPRGTAKSALRMATSRAIAAR